MRLLNTGNLEEMLANRKRRESMYKEYPNCNYKGECFARKDGKCKILNDVYFRSGKCSFQKPVREITNGRFYPANKLYHGGRK